VILPESALTVTGEVDIYELTSPSGRVSRQRMCKICHARIFNTNTGRPGFVVIRAGTLDRSNELQVVAHIWTKRKQPWIQIAEDVLQWPEAASPQGLMEALTAHQTS
jgi:hypothetical protein